MNQKHESLHNPVEQGNKKWQVLKWFALSWDFTGLKINLIQDLKDTMTLPGGHLRVSVLIFRGHSKKAFPPTLCNTGISVGGCCWCCFHSSKQLWHSKTGAISTPTLSWVRKKASFTGCYTSGLMVNSNWWFNLLSEKSYSKQLDPV